MPAGKQKHLAPFCNARLVVVAPEGKPERLHLLAGKTVRYKLPPVDEWETADEMVAEFYSMRSRLHHKMFGVLQPRLRDSPGVRPSTWIANFEALGRSIAGHAEYDVDGFVDSLRLALDGVTPNAEIKSNQ